MKHLVLGAALLTLAAAAHASTITQTVNFGPSLTGYSSSPGSPAVFTYFDSSLGTLNAVSFSSTYQISSQIFVTNASAKYSTGTVGTQSAAQFGSTSNAVAGVLNKDVNNTVDFEDGTTVGFGGSTLSPIAYDLRGKSSNYTLAPGATTSFTSAAISQNLSTEASASDLSAFFRPGGGTYSILLTTLTGLIISNSGGNTFGNQQATAAGSLTVNYTYTAAALPPVAVTPEPSSLLLMGTGLLGVLGAAKRRYA